MGGERLRAWVSGRCGPRRHPAPTLAREVRLAAIHIHHAPSDARLAEALADHLRADGFGGLSTRAPGAGSVGVPPETGRGDVRVVLTVVTATWLADLDAAREAAERIGKPTMAVVHLDEGATIDEETRARLRALRRTVPCIDLDLTVTVDARAAPAWPDLREALARLGARSDVGPDPAVFAVDPDTPPYRGLAPFGDADADAAVFFGRGRELVELLETLRARRATGDPRALVVTGPAGVGKSSLVAAGVLPRLRREAPMWTVLRFARPAPDPLLGFARAVRATLADAGASADAEILAAKTLAPELMAAELMAATRGGAEAVTARWAALARTLRDAAGRPESTLLWAVDARDVLRPESAGAAALCTYLREANRTRCRLLLTVRDDELEALRRALSPVPLEWHDLRPLPTFRVDEVVMGPAARHGVAVPPALVDDLIEDMAAYRHLGALSSTLALLWRRAPGEAGLRHEDYVGAGRMAGVLAEAPEPVPGALTSPTRTSPSRAWVGLATVGAATVLAALVAAFGTRLLWGSAGERPFHIARMEPAALSPEEEGALRPGAIFTECRDGCPSMVVLPAGRFLMGDERERDATMLPRHSVSIARPFAVGRTEVTFREYGACIDRGPCGAWPSDYRAPEWSGDKPVVHLAADRMRAYVGWLSRVTGRRYRLLSSAEWEYMARAGTTTAFFWGDQMLPGRAHCTEGCGSPYRDDRVEDRDFLIWTAPVASFAPNAFGVFDAHGNVWEVVEDCWHETYRGAPDDGSPWGEEDGGDCGGTVVRGGGWSGAPRGLRSASRDWLPPETTARPMVGFRVARDLERYAADR